MRRYAIVLLVLTLVSCGSSAPVRSESCTQFGGVADRSSAPVQGGPGRTALLSNVQVQASRCVDEVAFDFVGANHPGWSVGYVTGPFTEDPSGRPVDVAGGAFLRVRLEPASGFDLSAAEPHPIYDGPAIVRPRPPSSVVEVARLGDFEAVTTWLIALPARTPFEVTERGEQLVVRLPAARGHSTRCALEGSSLEVGYPTSWYAELSDRWACQYFDPAPFIVHPSTNDFRWKVTAQVADAPAATVLDRMRTGDSTLTTRSVRVAGFPATRLDVTASGTGMLERGWTFRMYVVDTGDRAVTLTGAAAPPGSDVAANAAAVDAVAALVTRR